MIHTDFYLESIILLIFFGRIDADWGSPDNGQYHIQTDEGPERFFRYQTDSGQFRNEKRLKDGTVIGTDAWIDALGYLRQKDYIADKDGYRILKSKTVFVGKSRPIKEVISNGRVNSKFATSTSKPTALVPVSNSIDTNDYGYAKKKIPDILVHYNAEPIDGNNVQLGYIPPSSTPAPPITTYKPFYSTTTILPLTHTYVSTTTTTTTPAPDIISSVAVPSKYFLPPPTPSDEPIVAIKPLNIYPTQIPIRVAAYTIEQINNELEPPSISANVQQNEAQFISSTHSTPTQSIGSHYTQTNAPSTVATISNNDNKNNAIPLFNRNTFYRRRPSSYQYYQPNQLDYNTKHFDRYNSQLANGFGYFLPRQYHEESYRDPQNRDGSFGYIDPFGIRRVVYYQTSPEGGFKIRKNNRYVGFNANPYDSK